MRLPIAALFLVATLAIAQTQNATKSSYEKDEPTKPAKQYPPQLVNDLIALREAALEDEYAYRQGSTPHGKYRATAVGIATGSGCSRLCGCGIAKTWTRGSPGRGAGSALESRDGNCGAG